MKGGNSNNWLGTSFKVSLWDLEMKRVYIQRLRRTCLWAQTVYSHPNTNSFWSSLCTHNKQPIMMKIKTECRGVGLYLLPLRLLRQSQAKIGEKRELNSWTMLEECMSWRQLEYQLTNASPETSCQGKKLGRIFMSLCIQIQGPLWKTRKRWKTVVSTCTHHGFCTDSSRKCPVFRTCEGSPGVLPRQSKCRILCPLSWQLLRHWSELLKWMLGSVRLCGPEENWDGL